MAAPARRLAELHARAADQPVAEVAAAVVAALRQGSAALVDITVRDRFVVEVVAYDRGAD